MTDRRSSCHFLRGDRTNAVCAIQGDYNYRLGGQVEKETGSGSRKQFLSPSEEDVCGEEETSRLLGRRVQRKVKEKTKEEQWPSGVSS